MINWVRLILVFSLAAFIFPIQTGATATSIDEGWLSNASGYNRAVYYGDWREVDGIRLPFSITQSMAQMTLGFTIEEVKHNGPLEETVFRRP